MPWPGQFLLCAPGSAGTGLAYITNFNVVRAAGPQTAFMVTYPVPVFAVGLGVRRPATALASQG